MGLAGNLRDFFWLERNRSRLDTGGIRKMQLKAVKDLVGHAKASCPFYARLYEGLKLESLEDFSLFPSIDKATMMENFDGINAHGIRLEEAMAIALEKERNRDFLGYFKDEFVLGLSSGTSGNKGLYLTPKSLTQRLPGVFLARGGFSPSDLPLRVLFCLRVFSQGFQDINAPFLSLRYLSTMTPPEEILETMRRERINALMAPPSLLRFLVPLMGDGGKEVAGRNIRLRKIVSYAEVLTAEDRRAFEAAFSAKVTEIYQASEGQVASPCRHGNLHVNEDLVYAEIADSGELVLTNLVNRAQPLIRYRMNDLIRLGPPCPCGSSFRRIDAVIGRQDDVMFFLDGEGKARPVFPDLMARWIITESSAIREFRAFQERPGALELTVDLVGAFDTATLEARLSRELAAFGLSGEIRVREGKLELPADRNKYRRFARA